VKEAEIITKMWRISLYLSVISGPNAKVSSTKYPVHTRVKATLANLHSSTHLQVVPVLSHPVLHPRTMHL